MPLAPRESNYQVLKNCFNCLPFWIPLNLDLRVSSKLPFCIKSLSDDLHKHSYRQTNCVIFIAFSFVLAAADVCKTAKCAGFASNFNNNLGLEHTCAGAFEASCWMHKKTLFGLPPLYFAQRYFTDILKVGAAFHIRFCCLHQTYPGYKLFYQQMHRIVSCLATQ